MFKTIAGIYFFIFDLPKHFEEEDSESYFLWGVFSLRPMTSNENDERIWQVDLFAQKLPFSGIWAFNKATN